MNKEVNIQRGILPGRCGHCKKFPGNKKICQCYVYRGSDGIMKVSRERTTYANDYGKGTCLNYEE
jgi:hypothetical protein